MKKKKPFWIFPLFVMSFLFMLSLTFGCEKDEKPEEVKNPAPDSIIVFNPDLTYDTVTDIDGNVYKTIEIGTQTWMAENLKVTKYNDGTDIPLVTDDGEWNNLSTPGYCWFKNDEKTYKKTFGALYNWHAVGTGKLCPTGWHVPDNGDWVILYEFAGADSVVEGNLKETGTTHWNSPNYGATNATGFTAIPAANRNNANNFAEGWLGIAGFWWSSSDYNANGAYWRKLYYDNKYYYTDQWMYIDLENDKVDGMSVRCLKDE